MKRTVVVAFGNAEARRYDIEHTGHQGPGGYTHPREDDYICAAKRRLVSEGFDTAQADCASFRFAD